jgi:hypothetical protein
MDQIPPQEEKEDHRPPEDQGDNSLVIDEEKPNEGRINLFNCQLISISFYKRYAVFGTSLWF